MTELLGKPYRPHSLRQRLLLAVSIVVLLTWTLVGILSYGKAQHEAEELMDGNLAQRAHLLLALLRDNETNIPVLAPRLAVASNRSANLYEPPLEFQFGTGDGVVLLRSASAPGMPITGRPGYSDIRRHHKSWRVLNIVSEDGKYRVQVAQSIDLRDRVALEVATQTLLPVGLIWPIALLLLYFSIRRGLLPLDRLASEISRRSSDNLAPLSNGPIPTEAKPLIDALNRLLFRVRGAMEGERRFTADAAHELRTPLAALKLQAQVALMADDPDVRGHALNQIQAGVDRASHLVEQLLRLARLDPLSSLPEPQIVDVDAVIQEAVAGVQAANPDARQQFMIEPSTAERHIAGDAGLLEIALRNLLENAIRYTPPETAIWISVRDEGGSLTLTVRDNGPGVPEVKLSRLSERFYRGRESDVEGSGLGLAIVARIAELHGAQLATSNHPEGGLVVKLSGLAKDCNGQAMGNPTS
jgi:two-component system, OmpR family, sensor histidine kinase QseC